MDLDVELKRVRDFIAAITAAGHHPEALEARLQALEAAVAGGGVMTGTPVAAPDRASVPPELRAGEN